MSVGHPGSVNVRRVPSLPRPHRPACASSRRLRAALAGAALVWLGAVHANPGAPLRPLDPDWIPASAIGDPIEYFIEAGSLRREGEMTRYRLVGREASGQAPGSTLDIEVGARCGTYERVEYTSTSRWRGNVRTETSTRLQPVLQGTRLARELEIACRLADQRASAAARALVAARPSAPSDPGTMPPPIRSTGTAFSLGGDLLVTNHHVVDGCRGLRVLRGADRVAAAEAADMQPVDLALVRAPGLNLPPIALADAPPTLGEPVVVLGYPLPGLLGPQLRVTTGIVSALGGLANEQGMFQISAPVQPGNSGGPVLDAAGRVVGVVTRKLDQRLGAENISFAIDLPTLRRFLVSQGKDLPATQENWPMTVAQVVRKTAPSLALLGCQ